MPSAPKQKQNAAARPTKRGNWGEDYLMTNPKSALVNADLVKLFSNPKAWECLDEEEKKHLLSLLPTHIHPNPDPDPDNPDAKIPALPDDFLRYDNNWRGALRNFQSDLESGRYKPAWQRQAKQAVQDRAEGKYDDFKEREFEQFWGQKQKINHGLIAGESSKVKLKTLIEHGVVRVGDVWKYSRLVSSKRTGKTGQVLVEKETKIIAIDGANLSFLVPAGQRTFLSSLTARDPEDSIPLEERIPSDSNTVHEPQADSGQVENPESNNHAQQDHPVLDLPVEATRDDGHESSNRPIGNVDKDTEKPPVNISLDPPKEDVSRPKKAARASNKRKIASVGPRTTRSKAAKIDAHSSPSPGRHTKNKIIPHAEPAPKTEPESTPAPAETYPGLDVSNFLAGAIEVASNSAGSNKSPAALSRHEPAESIRRSPSPCPPTILEHPQAETQHQPEQQNPDVASPTQPGLEPLQAKPEPVSDSPGPLETTLHRIAGPTALTKKIHEIDGRVSNPSNGNAWKEIRCYRDNQDMGSLWEVRQAWYIKFQQ
ncbi:uncharacterized protein TRUGW13939_04195 [Talaromyces rugulosus]|uniref:DEUBAD domain-containing protein n=1 Tax=Talaromyces rugulosus TaxID=121627 RepID=A0A7H8QSW3_TALRU|nr:uncharacterized protein TRUGW13939_04195 [Talaromyces rugulosus]QKX57087.1 hypothetical protein TRUGW13939_04195 [Talaromyces rugulosus]